MKRHYHFIGIGGIGMSALARILLGKGQKVSGSDLKETNLLEQLKNLGADVSVGHTEKNVKNPHAVVFSTDIPQENFEFIFAKQEGIPLLHRSELLAQLMEGSIPLLVTGTHGKTTTTSLLAHCLLEAGLDPSFAIGGYLRGMNVNGHAGKGLYFVAEADESDGTFLNYPSFGAIITNLEQDHMNYWQNQERLIEAFGQFASQVGSRDHLFWCGDDPHLRSLKLHGYSYGFHESCDLVIENFHQNGWSLTFDLSFDKKKYQNLEISLIGAHNVLNAAAVFGFGLKLDIKEEVLRRAFKTFKGVARRLEKKGEVKGIEIYDDYAHHPTEIFATLRALKSALHGRRLVVAFQPHRYTRTEQCMDDFAEAFEHADELLITEIYAASEKPIEGVTSEKVIDRIKKSGFKKVQLVERGKLPQFLSHFLKKGDILVTMGAGDITAVSNSLIPLLEKNESC